MSANALAFLPTGRWERFGWARKDPRDNLTSLTSERTSFYVESAKMGDQRLIHKPSGFSFRGLQNFLALQLKNAIHFNQFSWYRNVTTLLINSGKTDEEMREVSWALTRCQSKISSKLLMDFFSALVPGHGTSLSCVVYILISWRTEPMGRCDILVFEWIHGSITTADLPGCKFYTIRSFHWSTRYQKFHVMILAQIYQTQSSPCMASEINQRPLSRTWFFSRPRLWWGRHSSIAPPIWVSWFFWLRHPAASVCRLVRRITKVKWCYPSMWGSQIMALWFSRASMQ